MSRDDAIDAVLGRAGFAGAARVPIPQDAGRRRYVRLEGGPEPAVLMDAPDGAESVAAFLAVRAGLAAAGLSVPRLLAADAVLGLLLLEDFGPHSLAARLDRGEDQTPLFDDATDTLAVLGRVDLPGLPRWDAEAMTRATAETFLDWWWPSVFGGPAAPAIRAEFAQVMRAMLAPLDAGPTGLVHRDYFAANLFHLPGREGTARTGIIDFQDAAIGPAAYDLVSLTQDARRDLPPELTARAARRLLAARPDLDATEFDAAIALCAAQRHLRVAGLWVRLDRRDGKAAYLAHGPRCWRLLADALRHPATAGLRGFLDRHVPPALRANPGRAAA